ncbi:MAG: hypothetical protein IPI93_10435 [Sphingobacteriaceae bacterium]|nr:hypothetical protein [Sphingobacteriaceae bacterium]
MFWQRYKQYQFCIIPYLKTGDLVSKHSPYCGITVPGFSPRHNLLNQIISGNSDQIAIVVSKDELDYNALNQAISRSSRSDYLGKINEALRSILISSARFNNTNDAPFTSK